jgi:tetratricopeptide (TPR) repeat protein
MGALWTGSICASQDAALVAVMDKLVTQHKQLGEEIEALQKLLGREGPLDALKPQEADAGWSNELKEAIQRGNTAFAARKFSEAKDAHQEAWEVAPDLLATNYNLGLSYYRLGNMAMAKRMLKSALELDPNLHDREIVEDFLKGELKEDETPSKMSAEERKHRNEMLNMLKEMQSYRAARDLPLPKKLRAVTTTLDKMQKTAVDYPALKREFYYQMGEAFTDFELFDRALDLFQEYERAMEGEVLPDGYHSKLLQVEERKKALTRDLGHYLGNKPDRVIRRRLQKNLHELEIFSLQLEEFVTELDELDPDFIKIAKRLGEYPWGKRPARHVMVIDRFSDLIYSNLEGTLPIERYQDTQGRKFLKDITQLADCMELKQAEFFEVDLAVNGRVLPYVVMYTYVPKHQAFVVVRLQKDELR